MDPYFHYPAPANYAGQQFHQYPAWESSSSQTPFVYYVPIEPYSHYPAPVNFAGQQFSQYQEYGFLEDSMRFQHELDQFRLEDSRGQIVSMAMDGWGFRLLQAKFDSFNADEIDMIFREAIDHVDTLMMNQFGTCFIQKLIEACSDERRTELLVAITSTAPKFVSLCLDPNGSQALHTLLRFIKTPQQISSLMGAVAHGALRLTKDLNGHWVIYHCLKNFPHEDTRCLLREVAEHCLSIATDRNGWHVLPACLQLSRGDPREYLVNEIIRNAFILAEDPGGICAIMYLLRLKTDRVTSNIISNLGGRFFALSCNRFGSFVVQTCLTNSAEEQSRAIVKELLGNQNIATILTHPYGNYVFQSALAVSKGRVHKTLVKLVKRHSMSICENRFGKNILSMCLKKKNE